MSVEGKEAEDQKKDRWIEKQCIFFGSKMKLGNTLKNHKTSSLQDTLFLVFIFNLSSCFQQELN